MQFAVLTLRSTAPLDPIQYKTEAYQRWFQGNRTSLLLLVALEERKIAFETGYELEGILPDGLEARIIRDEMTPRFRAGDFAGGITAGGAPGLEHHREGPRRDARVGRPRAALLERTPGRRGVPAGARGLRRGDDPVRADPADRSAAAGGGGRGSGWWVGPGSFGGWGGGWGGGGSAAAAAAASVVSVAAVDSAAAEVAAAADGSLRSSGSTPGVTETKGEPA